MNQLKKKMMLV